MLQSQRPWGSYRILTQNNKCTVKILYINKGQRTSFQLHKKRSEFWTVIYGEVSALIENTTTRLPKGDSMIIEKWKKHRAIAHEDSAIVEISFGKFEEKDIVRFADDYGRR